MRILAASLPLGALVFVLQVVSTARRASALSEIVRGPIAGRVLDAQGFGCERLWDQELRSPGLGSQEPGSQVLRTPGPRCAGFLAPGWLAGGQLPLVLRGKERGRVAQPLSSQPIVSQPRPWTLSSKELGLSKSLGPWGSAGLGLLGDSRACREGRGFQGVLGLSCMARRRSGSGGPQRSQGSGSHGSRGQVAKGAKGAKVASGRRPESEEQESDKAGATHMAGHAQNGTGSWTKTRQGHGHGREEVQGQLSVDFERKGQQKQPRRKSSQPINPSAPGPLGPSAPQPSGARKGSTGVSGKQRVNGRRTTVRIDGSDEILIGSPAAGSEKQTSTRSLDARKNNGSPVSGGQADSSFGVDGKPVTAKPASKGGTTEKPKPEGKVAEASQGDGQLQKRKGNTKQGSGISNTRSASGTRTRKKKPKKESLYSVALRHQKRANYSAARRIFSMLCDDQEARGEEDGRVFLAWGRMEARLGNMGAARRAFSRGLQELPDNVHIVHAWAVEEMRDNNIDDARKLLSYALERDPSDGLLYQTFSLLEQQHGTVERARELLEQGTAADPTNVYLWNACGVFESKQGNMEAAVRMFEQATVLRPTHCQSWQAFGVVLEKLGKLAEAQDKFEMALQIDPRSVPTYQAYALMKAKKGDHEAARRLFAKGAELGPKHAPIFHAWATMEMKLGNHERARDLFHEGVEAAPSSVALLKSWALMELELGHIDSSNSWYVSPKMGIKRLEQMGDKLEMLRTLIEQRSEDDIKLVMKWIEAQKIKKQKQKVFEVLKIGAPVPGDWVMGEQYDFSDNYKFQLSEAVVVKNRDGTLVFGRIATKAKQDPKKPESLAYSVDVIRQSSKTLSRNSKGKLRRPPAVRFEHRNIGKVLLPQSEIVAQASPMRRAQPSTSAAVTSEQQILDDIMSRYGEDFTINPYMEVWWNDLDDSNKEADSESWEGQPDGWVADAEDTNAVKTVEMWLKRRSDEDVAAFKAWFNDMYEQDRGVGMKMLDWDLSFQQIQQKENQAPPPPREWSQLPDVSQVNATAQSGSISNAETRLRETFEDLGVEAGLLRLAEGVLILILLGAGGTFGPEFFSQIVQRGDPSANAVQGPSGVDAYLIQTDFSEESSSFPGQLDDCNSGKTPRYGKACGPKGTAGRAGEQSK